MFLIIQSITISLGKYLQIFPKYILNYNFPILVKQTDWCYILGSPKTNQLGNQVKHLLILLSILILSSLLFGYPSGDHTFFWRETSSGNMWKGFKEKVTHPQYNGDVKNGTRTPTVKEL